ncbi:MBL fold hydrolase [Streptomyces mashuensis]|uniref:MBL fold hydrolase n=1 Tax=Streptomyces mashuensis TaxID=33904 RepID=A0A919EC12_9ACTN|nr:MBL fold metallo-hydrolase [Streptomyces mashuensis]GHF35402.1 MBL fold hydrolase [Streptomyces mashuensis]
METHAHDGSRDDRQEDTTDGWERPAPGVARRRLPGWDATVGVVAGTTGVLVVDTGSSPHEGGTIRTAVERMFGLPVTYVALTHPHFDHVLGTPAFPGARVYAAVGAAALLQHDRDELRRDAVANGMDATEADEALARLVLPSHAVSGQVAVDLGGGRRALLVNVGPGHTAHDLAVLVPGGGPEGAPDVVFCGDLVEESGEPQAGPDALPHAWPAALDRLLELGGEDALYVPGHGAVVDAAFVRGQREQLAARFGGAGG